MQILICGSREWDNFEVIRNTFRELKIEGDKYTIIHGGCSGADSIAGFIAKEMGCKVQVFTADWKTYGKRAGPIRNQKMLDIGKPDMILAFHNKIETSKGTLDLISRAQNKGLQVKLIN